MAGVLICIAESVLLCTTGMECPVNIKAQALSSRRALPVFAARPPERLLCCFIFVDQKTLTALIKAVKGAIHSSACP